MILIDTSVYISAVTDTELEKALKKSHKKSFVISSEVVDDEIKESANYLRKTNRKIECEKLKEIYNSSIGGTIRFTDRVLAIANTYSEKVREKFGKDKAKDMKDDLRIVACASVAGLKFIGTFNRKTMANEEIIEIYNAVNKENKLKTPEFIKSREKLIALLSS